MNSKEMTKEKLAAMMEYNCLRAEARDADYMKLCSDAMERRFAMVGVNSCQVKLCKNFLNGSAVKVSAFVAFPLGQTSIDTKAFETRMAIEDGADEINYVLNIGKIKMGEVEFIEKEMQTIVDICREKSIICSVIFENCYLTSEDIKRAALIAKAVGPDYIQTSTGFGPYGAKVQDIKMMNLVSGDAVKVKAVGGIRSWDACRQMIDAGAECIGSSLCNKIYEEFLG